MNLRETISWLKTKIQVDLFPHVEESLRDPLTEKQKRLITTLEVMKIEDHVKSPEYQWMGRKLKDRYAIARVPFFSLSFPQSLGGNPVFSMVSGFLPSQE